MTAPASVVQEQIIVDPPDVVEADIVIIGSGMGGGTLAYALRNAGASVLLVEQGDFLPRERENWSFPDVHLKKRYKNSDEWLDAENGRDFQPGNYHYVGGNTKLYGATLPRFREADFGPLEHVDGVSPAWPISYADLEPFYTEAEKMYWVHANDGEDPTDPWRSASYPFAGLSHEGATARLVTAAQNDGLHPFAAPQALDYRAGGACVLCNTCDSFPCLVDAKGDADVCAVRPALNHPSRNIRLLPNARVSRLEADASGRRIVKAHVAHRDRSIELKADRFVLACGAVNTAALLLRSDGAGAGGGLANRSDQVGRNFMTHLTTFMIGIDPRRQNDAVYQKTFGINDWYFAGPTNQYPLGNIQGLGKLRGSQAKLGQPHTPLPILEFVTKYSLDLLVQSEDLPRADSRVTLDSRGRVSLRRQLTNSSAHAELAKRTGKLLRRAGFPIVLTRSLGVEATSHQCGTARMGDDPSTSVVDPNLKAHDLENLWVADSSTFPASAAVNPALTIAAQALRLGHSGALTE